MKATELIAALQSAVEQHGDLEVVQQPLDPQDRCWGVSELYTSVFPVFFNGRMFDFCSPEDKGALKALVLSSGEAHWSRPS